MLFPGAHSQARSPGNEEIHSVNEICSQHISLGEDEPASAGFPEGLLDQRFERWGNAGASAN